MKEFCLLLKINVKERLKKFIKSQNLKISDFEKSINASNGYINSISKGIGVDKLELIIENYPILNIEWLLTGNGSMLKVFYNGKKGYLYGNNNIIRRFDYNCNISFRRRDLAFKSCVWIAL